jgi:hypothetical protein
VAGPEQTGLVIESVPVARRFHSPPAPFQATTGFPKREQPQRQERRLFARYNRTQGLARYLAILAGVEFSTTTECSPGYEHADEIHTDIVLVHIRAITPLTKRGSWDHGKASFAEKHLATTRPCVSLLVDRLELRPAAAPVRQSARGHCSDDSRCTREGPRFRETRRGAATPRRLPPRGNVHQSSHRWQVKDDGRSSGQMPEEGHMFARTTRKLKFQPSLESLEQRELTSGGLLSTGIVPHSPEIVIRSVQAPPDDIRPCGTGKGTIIITS